jgi:hypothetical protein
MTLNVGDAQRIAFSADGQSLLAGMTTGLINRHVLDVQRLFALAAERVHRVLTQDEQERYGIDAAMVNTEILQGHRLTHGVRLGAA